MAAFANASPIIGGPFCVQPGCIARPFGPYPSLPQSASITSLNFSAACSTVTRCRDAAITPAASVAATISR
jgi:hypothetical protein